MTEGVKWLVLRNGQKWRFVTLSRALCWPRKCVLIVQACLACWVCLGGDLVQSQSIWAGRIQQRSNGQNRALCALTFRIGHFKNLARIAFQIHFCLILMLKHDFSRCFSLETPFADSNKNKFFEFKFSTPPKNTCLGQFSAARPVTKWSQNGRKIEKFSKSPKCCFWANFWWKSWFDQFQHDLKLVLASYDRRRQMTGFANWAKMTICDPQPSLVLISKVRFDLSSVFSVLSLPCRCLGAVAEHLGCSNPTALKWLKSSFVCSYLQNRTFQEFGKNRFSNHFLANFDVETRLFSLF